MHARTLALSLAPLLAALATPAHAQVADDDTDAPYGPVVEAPVAPVAPAAPVMAPVAPVMAPVAPAPVVMAPAMVAPTGVACQTAVRARPSVMANRWAVGLSVGSLSLAPEGSPDDDTRFGTGELALRFRATPHLELEASAGGGRERTADDRDGDLDVLTYALALRYRFRPEAAWNWFVMGGLGAAAVTRHDASDDEIEHSTQPLAMAGIGLERRFRHFALQAEARAIALGERDHDHDDGGVMALSSGPGVQPSSVNQEKTGGSLSIGVSYYF